MPEKKHVKVHFFLPQDEDGYPPDRWESLWAFELEQGLYEVDNIPLFASGVSSGDVIAAEVKDSVLQFNKVVQPSRNSVIRVHVRDAQDAQVARKEFKSLGCEWEQSHLPKLFAVEIPGEVPFGPVARLLDEGERSGRWEYEEGALRHHAPGD